MSDTKTQSSARRALDYAEKQLGVHSVYMDAQRSRKSLDDAMTEVASRRDTRRDLEFKIADREMDISLEESGHHPAMSQAAMDRHLKQVLFKDDQLRELRKSLSWCVSDIEGLEYDIRVIETDIRIAVARLTELGGHLTYLAAIKQAQLYKANETSETGEAR